jgi:hypothetical protein
LVLLFAIRLFHTALIAWLYSCLGYMIYAHTTGSRGKLLAVAYASVALEGVAVIPFSFRCPLTLYVQEHYGPDVSDGFIPLEIAQWVMPIGLALLALSLLIVPLRWIYLRRAGRP